MLRMFELQHTERVVWPSHWKRVVGPQNAERVGGIQNGDPRCLGCSWAKHRSPSGPGPIFFPEGWEIKKKIYIFLKFV